jgi:rSAM/selenodomain-associated transferase 1
MPDKTIEQGAIVVFARAPVAGKSKTRLIPVLGHAGAAFLHKKLIKHTLEEITSSSTLPCILSVMPTVDDEFFIACQRQFHVELRLQRGDNLGQRMFQAFEDVLSERPWAIVVGSDCPGLDIRDITATAKVLAGGYVDAVIGPAQDGGYYLIGLRRSDESLFVGIDWGTSRVLSTTLERIHQLGWRYELLDEKPDIDRPRDLQYVPEEIFSQAEEN